MERMKNGQLAAFMVGIATLALLSYNVTAVSAHGGGGHHGEHVHTHHDRGEHMHDGTNSVRHYHHDHDDYGDHYHNCRNIPGESSKGAGDNILSEQECQKHGGEWEPSGD
jgi:hypothetical protein